MLKAWRLIKAVLYSIAYIVHREIKGMSSETFTVETDRGRALVTAHDGDRTVFQKILRNLLARAEGWGGMFENAPTDGAYRSTSHFLRRHGRFYEGAWTGQWKKGLRHASQINAMSMSLAYGLKYVEGEALLKVNDPGKEYIRISYVWNADDSGALVDTTTCNGGLAYFGVEFSVDRAYETWCDGHSCDSQVIEDQVRGWPILRERWMGEKNRLRFPRSADLDRFRGKRIQEIRAELKRQQKETYEATRERYRPRSYASFAAYEAEQAQMDRND